MEKDGHDGSSSLTCLKCAIHYLRNTNVLTKSFKVTKIGMQNYTKVSTM